VIDPGQYLIVWCDEETAEPGVHAAIKLSAGGEYVAITDTDGVTVLDSITFGPQTANISFGRYPNGSDTWGFMHPTPLADNSVILGVPRGTVVPDRFEVSVFPNPFNPTTTIQYWLPNASNVEIEVCDIMGRTIWRAVAPAQQTGVHSLQWNGITVGGTTAGTGVYFLRVRTNTNVISKKLLLLK
jgi:hypothetical protein